MYATWEAKMLGDHNGGRGELGTTEPLGEVLYVSVKTLKEISNYPFYLQALNFCKRIQFRLYFPYFEQSYISKVLLTLTLYCGIHN